mgnify:CR=1 FL=1
METKESIRQTLVELMDEKRVKGVELAEAVGVSKQAVSNWRNGKSSIDIELIMPICDFFGITVNDFFGRSQTIETASNEINSEERELIYLYRRMDDGDRQGFMVTARALAYAGDVKKDESVGSGVMAGLDIGVDLGVKGE